MSGANKRKRGSPSLAHRINTYVSSLYGDGGRTLCRLLRNITYVLFGIAPGALLYGVINIACAAVCVFSGGFAGFEHYLGQCVLGFAAAALLVVAATTLISLAKITENTRPSAPSGTCASGCKVRSKKRRAGCRVYRKHVRRGRSGKGCVCRARR